jgi:anthranilate synthase component 1
MAAGYALQPVVLEDATLLSLHAAFPDRYPALFESAGAGGALGRYDILFACPGAELTLHANGSLTGPAGTPATGSFLSALDAWWQTEAIAPNGDSLPFSGGWLLYLGYELAAQIEPRLTLPALSDRAVARAIRVPAAIVREHGVGAWIVCESAAQDSITAIQRDLEQFRSRAEPSKSLLSGPVEEDPPARFLDAVHRALDYISAGDIYQANLSRGWRAQLSPGAEPHDLYRRLRETNPGPFSGLLHMGEHSVISSSPERLVEVRDGGVSTRPIAGTRPRGPDVESDLRLARELYSHPKERAEHVMLIDLERNDLGRVCTPGSVHVDEFMQIESYAHVHHIVSNIRGRLRQDVTPGAVLAAVFPGGTITGCPKVRCIEIVAELEGAPRSAYTGSFGYLNLDGSLDMNILIRSVEVHGRELSLRAGAGIVADSIPERELEETRAKARGVLRALGEEGSSR